MNENEIARIAAAVNALRPDWPIASLRTLLGKPELTNRPRRDVAVALAWIACESDSKTPARVLEAGPWWKATGVDETGTHIPARTYGTTQGDPREVCGVCQMHRSDCETRARTNGHAFTARVDMLPDVDRTWPATPARRCYAQVVDGAQCRLDGGHDGPHELATQEDA